MDLVKLLELVTESIITSWKIKPKFMFLFFYKENFKELATQLKAENWFVVLKKNIRHQTENKVPLFVTLSFKMSDSV